MIDSEISIDKQSVFYKYGFSINDVLHAFKNKNLFRVSDNSFELIKMTLNNNSRGYWIGRKFVYLSEIEIMTKQINKTIDISNFQWYIQEQIKAGEYWVK